MMKTQQFLGLADDTNILGISITSEEVTFENYEKNIR